MHPRCRPVANTTANTVPASLRWPASEPGEDAVSVPYPVKRIVFASALIATVLVPVTNAHAATDILPSGFQDQTVFTGLSFPTKMVFAPDGRVFVAEKSG